MDVSILIPYRATCNERAHSFSWVCDRWEAMFPEYELIVADSGNDTFNRAASRNVAAQESKGQILVFADSDTFISRENFVSGLETVRNGDWVVPYTNYYNLTREYSEKVLSVDPTSELLEYALEWEFCVDKNRHPPDGSWGGILMMSRDAYNLAGGWDERFRGWGCDDDAFAHALNAVWGNRVRLPGFVCHLWHPANEGAGFTNPEFTFNQTLLERYRIASTSQRAMLSLIGENRCVNI